MKFVEGQIIKNVKELGMILGKEVKEKVQTKTKNSWLKELDTYCTWHKEGQKFIIDEVFAEQKEKVDGRANNGKGAKYSYYADYIDKLILHTLYENSGYLNITLKNLFTEEIKLFNKDGITELYNSNDKNIKRKFKINPFWNEQFVYIFRNIYTDMFKSSCKRLEKKGYITWHKDYMYIDSLTQEKQAMDNQEQIEKVKKIETEEKEKMGVKNPYFNEETYEMWNKECVERIKNEIDEKIFRYWSCYTLDAREDVDDDIYDSWCLEQEEVDRLTKELGKTILWRLHEKLQSYKHKQKQDFGEDIIYKPFKSKNILEFVLKAEHMIFAIDTEKEIHENDKTIFLFESLKGLFDEQPVRIRKVGLVNKSENNDNAIDNNNTITDNMYDYDITNYDYDETIICTDDYDMYDESLLPF